MLILSPPVANIHTEFIFFFTFRFILQIRLFSHLLDPQKNKTPLIAACEAGDKDTVFLLLSKPEIDVNKCIGSRNALLAACEIQNQELIVSLLNAGADPERLAIPQRYKNILDTAIDTHCQNQSTKSARTVDC